MNEQPRVGSCFFCANRPGTKVFYLKPPAKWPPPMQPDAGLMVCDLCDDLSPADIARVVMEYVDNLRRIHNRKVRTVSN